MKDYVFWCCLLSCYVKFFSSSEYDENKSMILCYCQDLRIMLANHRMASVNFYLASQMLHKLDIVVRDGRFTLELSSYYSLFIIFIPVSSKQINWYSRVHTPLFCKTVTIFVTYENSLKYMFHSIRLWLVENRSNQIQFRLQQGLVIVI